ncbi:hypothetical protein DUZ99_05775 [Xylanibacillus composti]|uniref:Uncharacterized protein n=1 Tax=Xylanibacillus composti TaxID=1572762 RepID=A0A8J4H584_9BACL|nr:hypothetical protein [Xylanibacillus composti]MDT9724498.1 hypothetical protein [Xylanibacillus composti]GIQ69762.1 hypothetical protein XYCOK13_25860 [Xylanibacillus composti]
MQKHRYNSKWVISYKGKAYATVYGKKKAYEMYVRLSHCMVGLSVEPAPKRDRKRTPEEIAEYNRQWRRKNPDKVKAYNRRSYLKKAAQSSQRQQGDGRSQRQGP